MNTKQEVQLNTSFSAFHNFTITILYIQLLPFFLYIRNHSCLYIIELFKNLRRHTLCHKNPSKEIVLFSNEFIIYISCYEYFTEALLCMQECKLEESWTKWYSSVSMQKKAQNMWQRSVSVCVCVRAQVFYNVRKCFTMYVVIMF